VNAWGDQQTGAAELPTAVRRHVERALSSRAAPRQVRISQRGEMWLKPGGRGMAFLATQSFAIERVAFWWRARFPLVGPLALTVVDEYVDGDGQLAVRLLGLPLQRQRGAETVSGEALRYLAELAFAPPAILHNRELEWRDLDERTAEVATTVRGERLTVKLEVDNDGDIVHASSEMRRYKVGDEWVPTPWGGDFRDYQSFGGLRIPSSGEAYWQLAEGRYVYWRGTVISAESLDEPFRRSGS
jgi:hypothetical protein